MLRDWHHNVIETENTGATKYSVCDSVEEEGYNCERKKPPVKVWSVFEELAIIHQESRSSTNKQSLWIYQ